MLDAIISYYTLAYVLFFIVKKGMIKLSLHFLHCIRAPEELIENIRQRDGCGCTPSIHHYANLSDNLSPFEVIWVAILIFHKRSEEIIQFLASPISLQPPVGQL